MFRPHDFHAICDRCGFKRYHSELKKEWNGLMVCRDTCWEPKHPQLSIRAKKERPAPKDTRPEAADVELAVGDVTADDL